MGFLSEQPPYEYKLGVLARINPPALPTHHSLCQHARHANATQPLPGHRI